MSAEWSTAARRLGMRDLLPDRLSEVELLKHLGDRHWAAIAAQLGVPPEELRTDDGERLYASFASVELGFPEETPLWSFGEGAALVDQLRARIYARRFVEGQFVLGGDALDDDALAAVGHVSQAGRPWATLTSAFVARSGSNHRLVVREPAGADAWRGERLASLPEALRLHQAASRSGRLPEPAPAGAPLGQPLTVAYALQPELDLNGAGLFYFARYVGVFDRAVRRFAERGLPRPLSAALADSLLTRHRRVAYFANAEPWDHVRCVLRAARLPDPDPAPRAGRVALAALRFHHDLYRAGDRVWMATGSTDKVLAVREGDRAARDEAERLLGALEGGA